MKRFFSIGVLIALAALTLGSCAKDIEEEVVVKEPSLAHSVSFNVSMGDQTRTGLAFKFVPNWIKTDEKNNVHLFETHQGETIEGENVVMDIEEGRHNEVAHFSAEFYNMTIIVNPPSGTSALTRAGGDNYYYTGIVAKKVDNKFIVPEVQYPDSEALIDPNADFLVGDGRKGYDVSQSEKPVDLYFLRPVAASRLAIMNVEKGTVIKKVVITSSAKLTGSAAYDAINFETGDVSFDANSGSTSITLDYGDGVAIPGEATFYAYFISLAGQKPITSIEVTTDTHVYTKNVNKTLNFKTEDFKNIAVDMSKVTPTPVGPAPTTVDQPIKFHKGNGEITSDSFTLGSGTYALPTLEGVAEGATVTWTLEDADPEDVAALTHVGNAWTLTPQKAGTVTVKVTASAVEGYNETSKSYLLTIKDAGTQTLVFTPDALTVTLGEEFTEPALTGNKTAVTYSIDPEGVATIDATNGKLTLVAAGNATVTATAAAGQASDGIWYAEASKTYALTVNAAATLVTVNLEPATELVAGEKYVLVSNGFALVRNGENASAAAFDATAVTVAVPEDLRENLEWTLEKKSGSITRGNEYAFTQGTYFFGIAMNTNESTYTYTVEVNNGRQVATNVSIQDHNISLASDLIYYAGNSSNYYVFYNTADSKWDNEKIGNTATPAATSKTALYKLKDMREEQNPTFSSDEAEYDLYTKAWTKAVPTLRDAQGTVEYGSSDTDVVTVNVTSGAVTVASTARKGDTAVITANAAGNETYKPGSASYTISIVNTNPNVTKYEKVTSTADLEPGAKYLLVFEGLAGDTDGDGDPKVFNPVLNSDGTQFAKATTSALDVTIANGVIESSDFDDCQFTLEAGYYLKGDKANKYIYPGTVSSGSGWGASTSNVMLAENAASNALTIAFSGGIAEISNGGNYLVWSISSHYFSCNTAVSGQYSTGICLYKMDDGRQKQTLVFSGSEAKYDLGTSSWTVAVPTLSGNQTSPLTWTSSDETVATVDASGTVTPGTNKGTATIKVTAPADATYKSGSASFTVTVFNSNVPTYYKADAFVADEQYLVVSNGHALRNNGGAIAAVEVVVNDGVIKYDAAATDLWTAKADESGFRLSNNDRYLRRQSNNLVISSSTSSTPGYNRWTYDAENEHLVVNGSSYLNYSNNTFALSSSAQNAALYTTTPPKKTQSLSFDGDSAVWDKAGSGTWTESVPNLDRSGAETTVTFASSNTAVAEVNTTSGAVTISSTAKAGDSAIITATAVGTDEYVEATASYTISIIDSTPVAQVLTFSAASLTGQVGATVTPPTLNGAHTDVTYTSSEPTFATVDANTGALSLLAEGTTTITAVAAAGTGTDGVNYAQGTGSYILTVTAAPSSGGKTYTRINGQSELVTGTYLVVSVNNQNKVLKGGTGDGADRGAVVDATTAPMSMSGNTITISDESVCDVYEYVITRTGNQITLKGKLGYLRQDRNYSGNNQNYNNTTYIGFEDDVTDNSTFIVNTNPASNQISGADAVFFSVKSHDSEYLYYNTTSPGYFKLGGSGAPSSSKYGGVFLYKLNDGGTTPEPPTPSTPTYTKVDAMTSGATYLIVAADANNYNGNGQKRAFKGDTSGSVVELDGTSGTITGDYSSCEFVITAEGANYSLKGPGGYVTGQSSTDPYIQVSTDKVTMALTDAATLKTADNRDGLVSDAFYFYYLKGSSTEVLYLNSNGKFKIGGSGRKYGVYLYKKN